MKISVFFTVLILIIICLPLTPVLAQSSDSIFKVSGDLTTIYTLGNANKSQLIPAPGDGAYYATVNGAQKNGYYTAANVYVNLNPFPWMDGYFKVYMIHRTGSFYLPLQMENLSKQDTVNLTLDAVYGKVSVFQALELESPFELYLKAGRYKAVASNYGSVSKYNTELILDIFKTKTDFNYEIGVSLDSPFKLDASLVTNYRFDEAIQRVYDEDGAVPHGGPVPDGYAFQLLSMVKLHDFELGIGDLSAEILYGNNIGGDIYSGNSLGFSARYNAGINNEIKVPAGLLFGYYQKNLDLLGHAAVNNAANGSLNLRDTISLGLGTGLRYSTDLFNLDLNLAATYNLVKHIYRDDLQIIKFSLDAMFTLQEHFFVGAGFIAGTLGDAQWKTRDNVDPTRDLNGYDHTFTFAENYGYEAYIGINLAKSGKFVIGFNQNKGLSLNHMLEAKTEGQVKYKQADTVWNDNNQLVEAGGLYTKFVFSY